MTLTTYEVIGRRVYRGHKPGDEFTARLDQAAERRAILRGDIRVVDRCVPALPPDHSLPPGWADRSRSTETPQGVSLVEGRR